MEREGFRIFSAFLHLKRVSFLSTNDRISELMNLKKNFVFYTRNSKWAVSEAWSLLFRNQCNFQRDWALAIGFLAFTSTKTKHKLKPPVDLNSNTEIGKRFLHGLFFWNECDFWALAIWFSALTNIKTKHKLKPWIWIQMPKGAVLGTWSSRALSFTTTLFNY